MEPIISDVRFTPARVVDRAVGLDGFASATVNGLRIAGIAVRRAHDGRRLLTFPSRRDRTGKKHAIVLPIDRELQLRIERAVIAELERQGVLP